MNLLLNSLNFKNNREIKTILVDGTDIQIDLNWHGRKFLKKVLRKNLINGVIQAQKVFILD